MQTIDIKGQRTLTLANDALALPGQILRAHLVLPDDMQVFRPTSFVFDDPEHWVITDFSIADRSQLKAHHGVLATKFDRYLVEIEERSTAQAKMTIAMTAIAQRNGLRFRCALTGAWA